MNIVEMKNTRMSYWIHNNITGHIKTKVDYFYKVLFLSLCHPRVSILSDRNGTRGNESISTELFYYLTGLFPRENRGPSSVVGYLFQNERFSGGTRVFRTQGWRGSFFMKVVSFSR